MRNLSCVTFYVALFVLSSRESGILCSEIAVTKSTNLRNGCTLNSTLKEKEETQLNDTNDAGQDILNPEEDIQELIQEVQRAGGEGENIHEPGTPLLNEKRGNIRRGSVLSGNGVQEQANEVKEEKPKEQDEQVQEQAGQPAKEVQEEKSQEQEEQVQEQVGQQAEDVEEE
ncbi:hypothetical protein C922_03322, partial [Plasmodium inui San Antonio 1]